MEKIILVLVDERTAEFEPRKVDVIEGAAPIDLRKVPPEKRADTKLAKELLARIDDVDAQEERLRHILNGEPGTWPFQWYEGREGFTLTDRAQFEPED